MNGIDLEQVARMLWRPTFICVMVKDSCHGNITLSSWKESVVGQECTLPQLVLWLRPISSKPAVREKRPKASGTLRSMHMFVQDLKDERTVCVKPVVVAINTGDQVG